MNDLKHIFRRSFTLSLFFLNTLAVLAVLVPVALGVLLFGLIGFPFVQSLGFGATNDLLSVALMKIVVLAFLLGGFFVSLIPFTLFGAVSVSWTASLLVQGKASLRQAFANAKKRYLALLLGNAIWLAFFSLPLVVCILFQPLLNTFFIQKTFADIFFSAPEFALFALVCSVYWTIQLFLAVMLAVLWPFLLILQPCLTLENKKFMDCIKKALFLARTSYARIWGMCLGTFFFSVPVFLVLLVGFGLLALPFVHFVGIGLGGVLSGLMLAVIGFVLLVLGLNFHSVLSAKTYLVCVDSFSEQVEFALHFDFFGKKMKVPLNKEKKSEN